MPRAAGAPGPAAPSLSVAVLLAALALAGPAAAGRGETPGQTAAQMPGETLVVRNDRGGSVIERARRIRALRRAGTRVELRGEVCLSACTMYLGLPRTCVEPGTVFGFHGPSSRLYGIALKPDSFETWSTAMASYYPEPIRSWYLQTARQRIVGFYRIRGAELIAMGIARCAG